MPRVMAYKGLFDGTAARLRPDGLYQMALAAGLSEATAAGLRDARENALAENAAADLD